VVIADFEHRLGTELTQIVGLAVAFTAWARQALLTQPEIFQVNLVLEELATNAIVHGLGVGQPGWVRLRVTHAGDHLALQVRDNALPFDPFGLPAPELTADLDSRPVGGLGVYFVRTLMDQCSYARVGDENVVTLRKNLGNR